MTLSLLAPAEAWRCERGLPRSSVDEVSCTVAPPPRALSFPPVDEAVAHARRLLIDPSPR